MRQWSPELTAEARNKEAILPGRLDEDWTHNPESITWLVASNLLLAGCQGAYYEFGSLILPLSVNCSSCCMLEVAVVRFAGHAPKWVDASRREGSGFAPIDSRTVGRTSDDRFKSLIGLKRL